METIILHHDSGDQKIPLYKLLFYSKFVRISYEGKFEKEEISELDLSGNTKQVFDLFIYFLDNANLPRIRDAEIAEELLHLAEYFEMPQLIEKLTLKKEPVYHNLEDLIGEKKWQEAIDSEDDITPWIRDIKLPLGDCVLLFGDEIFKEQEGLYFVSDGDVLLEAYIDEKFPKVVSREIFKSLSLKFFDKIQGHSYLAPFDFEYYISDIMAHLNLLKDELYTSYIEVEFRKLKFYISLSANAIFIFKLFFIC